MSGTLPSLGPRGEGWVGIQFVLLALVAAAGTLGPAWDGTMRLLTTIAGGLVGGAGLVLAVRGLTDLRAALTPLPRPRDGAELIDGGAYSLVRHPIYGGIILGATGFGLVTAAPAALLGAVVLLGFFDLKARLEEAWLEGVYDGYPAYRERTRKLIPFLY